MLAHPHATASSPAGDRPLLCQPGEIWRLHATLPDSMRVVPQGGQDAGPRYVMIVAEVEGMMASTAAPWLSVMPLSLETQFLSDVDPGLPVAISGLPQEVLVETWHLLEVRSGALAGPVGHRLSRPLYDLLLTVGDGYHGLTDSAPPLVDLQQAGLRTKEQGTHRQAEIQAFHRRETAWGEDLMQHLLTEQAGWQWGDRIVQEALQWEREWIASHPRMRLGVWLQGQVEAGWQTVAEAWSAGASLLSPVGWAIATRSSTADPPQPTEIAAWIEQLHHATDEHQRRRAIRQLARATGSTAAIQALVDLLQTTPDDETLWTVVESLWQLDPGNPAAGVRRLKVMDLGMQVAGQPVALAIAIVPRGDQRLGVLLQVYPTGNHPYLPADLKLVLLDAAGQSLREVTARQTDVYIQLKLSGEPNEEFSVRVELGTARITEDFVL